MKRRRRIWRTRHQLIAAIMLLGIVAFGVVIYPLLIIFKLYAWSPFVTWSLFIGNVVLIANSIISDRRAIRHLKQYDYQCCIPCGYPLANLAAKGHCPECGEAYDIGDTQQYWRSCYRLGFFFPLKP